MDELTPQSLLIIVVITLTIWIGGQVVHGTKVLGKKIGCVLIHKGCKAPEGAIPGSGTTAAPQANSSGDLGQQ